MFEVYLLYPTCFVIITIVSWSLTTSALPNHLQGRKDNVPAFTMREIEDGKYAVDFHAQFSSLQAFSICVAILHTAEDTAAVVQQRRNQMLHVDSMGAFAKEEVKQLIDEKSEEEKFKVNKKTGEVLPYFVLDPPSSPIARV